MELQKFVINDNFSVTLDCKNVVHGSNVYATLHYGAFKQRLSQDALNNLTSAYDSLGDICQKIRYTGSIQYHVHESTDETNIHIRIRKIYQHSTTVRRVWTLIFTKGDDTVFIPFSRTALWDFNVRELMLQNAISHWEVQLFDTAMYYAKRSRRGLESLQEACKMCLLKNAEPDKFISTNLLQLAPISIQKYLREWNDDLYEAEIGFDYTNEGFIDYGSEDDF
jgi:hypothetical protein